jgi:hypothetical protein
MRSREQPAESAHSDQDKPRYDMILRNGRLVLPERIINADLAVRNVCRPCGRRARFVTHLQD